MLAITEPTKLEGMTALGSSWYVARTQSGREHYVACKWLEAGAGDVQNTQLCRWAQRAKPIRRNTVKKYEAVLPGYLFVYFDPQVLDWDKVRNDKHYFGLLPLGRDAMAIPSEVVDEFKLAEEVGAFDYTKPPEAGTKVEIIEHALAGITGQIKLAKRAEDRTKRFIAIITTRFFGSDREVTISGSKLRKVDS